jgi:carboxymethylenebutenolidase
MSVRWETTDVGGKPMRIYMGMPDCPSGCPGVVIAQHAGGVDEFIQDVVHRLHREGYAAAAPELFHRQPASGLEPLARIAQLKDTEIIEDINAAIAHMRARSAGVAAIGVAGFCMGGRVSYLTAAASREIRAAAVFYGGNIMKPLGGTIAPFECTAEITCPVIGFFGADDTNPSPDDMHKIAAELTRLGKWHEFHAYRDAGHAFLNFISPERYCGRQAQAAWHEMLAFFAEYLKRPA